MPDPAGNHLAKPDFVCPKIVLLKCECCRTGR
jgi:hypothetical protein